MSSSPRPDSDRVRLATKLRELRAATGMSGNRFAQQLGWPQSRVSKIETGAQFPTGEDIAAWLRAAGAESEQGAVTALLTRARVETVSFRHAYRELGGTGAKQRSYREQERQATRIAVFQPMMVPGLLQTAAYARAVAHLPASYASLGEVTSDDAEQMVAARIERQALLYEPGKTLSFVLGEAALLIRMGSIETQLGQLDRLQSVLGLSTVDLRILPFTAVMPLAPPHGFEIYDDGFVLIETISSDQLLRDPEELRRYGLKFDHLQAVAARGDAAGDLIRRASRQLAGELEP